MFVQSDWLDQRIQSIYCSKNWRWKMHVIIRPEMEIVYLESGFQLVLVFCRPKHLALSRNVSSSWISIGYRYLHIIGSCLRSLCIAFANCFLCSLARVRFSPCVFTLLVWSYPQLPSHDAAGTFVRDVSGQF